MPDRAHFGRASGILSKPEHSGVRPAIVLMPAIAGINDYIVRVANRLAINGYVAFALDYYAERDVPDLSSPDRIMAAVASLSDDDILTELGDAIAGLEARDDVADARVGVVGFCLGGSYALLGASTLDGMACSVTFYGLLSYTSITANKPHSPLEAIAGLACPLLGHFGDEDHLVPARDVVELQNGTAGKPAEIYRYPGAGHAFHEDFRDVYRPVAAQTAWLRTMIFLEWYLRERKLLIDLPKS